MTTWYDRYNEPHRRYHTHQHLEECLALLHAEKIGDRWRRILRKAILYHDAVYGPPSTSPPSFASNELRSALLAYDELDGDFSEEERVEIARLILLTAGHKVAKGDRVGALMVSIDLAILGAEPARYQEYSQQIAEEYSTVPADVYRQGRMAFLRGMIDAPVIYPLPEFEERYGEQARQNMNRELALL